MLLFGSGINFFGGPGECNHKKFVKDPANNTQLQLEKYNTLLAKRWYETNTFELATEASQRKFHEQYRLVGKKPDEDDDDDDDKYFLGGTYKIRYNLNILDSSYSYSISDNTSP